MRFLPGRTRNEKRPVGPVGTSPRAIGLRAPMRMLTGAPATGLPSGLRTRPVTRPLPPKRTRRTERPRSEASTRTSEGAQVSRSGSGGGGGGSGLAVRTKPSRASVVWPSHAGSLEAKWSTPGRWQRYTAAVSTPAGGAP